MDYLKLVSRLPFMQRRIDDQYRRPAGVLGRLIGAEMAQDHQPENTWTVTLLDVQPNDQVLELGFGPGIAIQALSGRVTTGQIAGIDLSRTMLRVAAKRNAAAVRRGRVALHHGDAAHLPFEENTFDKAFGIHTIYFWRQPIAVLREVWRVLKPGGMIALTVLPKDKWNAHDPSATIGTPDCTPYGGDEILRLLKDAGFSSPRITSDADPEHPSNFTVIGVKAGRGA